MNKNRKGKVLIDGRLYSKEPEIIKLALAEIKFLPFRVEHLALQDKFELCGESFCFDEIEEGDEIPEYSLNVELNEKAEYHLASVTIV